jgi:hypothetical protein
MADKPNDFMGIVTLDDAIQQLQKIREQLSWTSECWMEVVDPTRAVRWDATGSTRTAGTSTSRIAAEDPPQVLAGRSDDGAPVASSRH